MAYWWFGRGNLYKYLSWSSESVVSCPFGALAGDVWFQSVFIFYGCYVYVFIGIP